MHMYANVIKIYHVIQEFLTFLRAANRLTDGRTDSHSDYSADPRVVQITIIFPQGSMH